MNEDCDEVAAVVVVVVADVVDDGADAGDVMMVALSMQMLMKMDMKSV